MQGRKLVSMQIAYLGREACACHLHLPLYKLLNSLPFSRALIDFKSKFKTAKIQKLPNSNTKTILKIHSYLIICFLGVLNLKSQSRSEQNLDQK